MTLVFGRFELDPVSGELLRDGRSVALQQKPLAILLHLVLHRDRWVRREELLAQVWPDVVVSDAAVASALHHLREALGDDGRGQLFVRTMRSRGYRFVAPVEQREPSAPPAHAGRDGPHFVGRREIVATFEDALESALAGRGGMVLLAGEPGIGKTRTARELLARARARSVPVHAGACDETGGAPVYWPWQQALRSLVAGWESAALRARLGSRGPRLAQILPGLRERIPDLPALPREEPEAARFELFDATASLLRDAAVPAGLVLHIDDVHRGDEASLALLAFLARELMDSRILVITGHRDAEADATAALAELLQVSARLDGCVHLTLGGLEPAAVSELIEHLAGTAPCQTLVEAVQRRTDGNPFLIRELVAHAASDPAGLSHAAEAAVPAGVRAMTRARVRSLSPEARAVLELAAVIGREFDLQLLAGARGEPPETVGTAIDEAVRSGVVLELEDGRARFAHVLLRDAIYRAQPASRRAASHRRVAEALERLGARDPDARLAELAHHFAQAAPAGGVRMAVDYAARAGRRALELYAFADAAVHFERALALLDRAPTAGAAERCDLLLDLGTSVQRLGRRVEHRETLRRAAAIARDLRDPDRLARAAYGIALGDYVGDADLEGAQLLEEALAAMARTDSALRIRCLARLAQLLQSLGHAQRADAALVEATASAERLDDPAVLRDVMFMRTSVGMARSIAPETLLDDAQRGIAFAELAGAATQLFQMRVVKASQLLVLGDRPGVEHELALVAEGARADWLIGWRIAQYRILSHLASGELAQAEAPIQEQLEAGRSRAVTLSNSALPALFLLRREQDRLGELAPLLLGTIDQERQDPVFRAWTAQILLELGRHDESRRELERFAEEKFAAPSRFPGWMTLAILADVCILLNDSTCAESLLERLAPQAPYQLIVSTMLFTLGPAVRLLGALHALCGRDDLARRCLTEARAKSREMGWILWERYVDLDEANLLLASRAPGDRTRALELAAAVASEARQRGLTRLARLSEGVLAHASAGRGRLEAV
jgi:DNA-binding winged helix-turn-helix (wHTH) protein